ncbi:MAG TPA: uracil-DNA glycosylase [Candidatus Dormibacteraeota bacterium]|nr:uracil-DNA glycosylase [Candidatus Dormibacteraeota bacterium]
MNPSSPPAGGSAELDRLHAQIRACTRCGLHATRTQAVPGTGPVDAEIMIVGEAPGFTEDVQGQPFVGPAGKLLDTLLQQIGLSRAQVFITNVLKCRPPQNRDPMPTEAETCLPYLRQQFALVRPKAVLILGRHALERMLPGVGTISRVHGQIFMRSGVAFIPCYHPAAALHNGSLVADLQKDFDRVREYLDQLLNKPDGPAGESEAPTREPEPEQLPLI